MRTLLVRPTIPTPTEILDPVLEAPLGREEYSRRPLTKRARREFDLTFAVNDQYGAERVQEIATYSGGYTPLWFDGNAWSEIQNPYLVFVGDGVTTQIIVPFKNLFPSSCVFYEDGIVKTDWTMPDDGVSGIVVFTTPPASESEITFIGKRKIKVVLVAEEHSVQSAEIAPFEFRERFRLRELG